MKKLGLVLAMIAMVGLTSAVAFAECPGASKVPEGAGGKQAGDMPSGCPMQMNPGTSPSSAGDVEQADVGHAKGCCGMMSRGMCAQRMDPGCPMMLGQAPGCCQAAGAPQCERGRDSKCCRGGKHGGGDSHAWKSGGMECCGRSGEKAHMKRGQMGCEAPKGKHGYATVIL